MKLQNNQTGQVENFCIDKDQICSCDRAFVYDSITQLQEAGWEDYEEPKEFWYIDTAMMEVTYNTSGAEPDVEEFNKEVGNYFETEEEAEKAVEKLKALKRLKDNGFRFEGIKQDYTRFFNQQKPIRIGRKYLQFNKAEDEEWLKENGEDLDLLFGGEE